MAVWETWLLVNVLADLLYRQLPFYSTEGHVEGKIQLYTVPVVLDCRSSTRELPKNDIKKIFISVPLESEYENCFHAQYGPIS